MTTMCMANHFWANDNGALNIILDRMLKSKRACETLLKVFEKRAQIEQEYGQRLLKLSQVSFTDYEEPGSSILESVQHIPTVTEATARAHMDLAQQIHQLLETPLAGFIKEQKMTRKKTMNGIDKIQNLRFMHLSNVKRARQEYIAECIKLEKAQINARVDPHANKEELVQLRQRVEIIEHEYRLSVMMLESVSKSWINDWQESCNVFQSLEEKRIEYMQGALNSYASMISNVCSVEEQSCERIKSELEGINIPQDMELFIKSKGTGASIPVIPKFSRYPLSAPEPPFEPDAPEPEPVRVHEINIPVLDEELRSVSEQLKKLPPQKQSTKTTQISHPTVPSPQNNSTKKREPLKLHIVTELPSNQEPRAEVPPAAPLADTKDSVLAEQQAKKALPALPAQQTSHNVEKTSTHDAGETLATNGQTKAIHATSQMKQSYLPDLSFKPLFIPFAEHQSAQYETSIQPDTKRPPLHELIFPATAKASPATPSSTRHLPSPHDVIRNTPSDPQHDSSLLVQSPLSFSPWPSESESKKDFAGSYSLVTATDGASPSPRKGKKRNLFPFVKKKSEASSDRSRFSLGMFSDGNPKKDDRFRSTVSSLHSRFTSPITPSQPGVSPTDLYGRKDVQLQYLPDGTRVLEYVRAQWDYQAKFEAELTFQKEDILAVISKEDDGWWQAQIVHSTTGVPHSRGLVPGNFMSSL